jgi:outer membrane protein OmpA-like peptidoglycan-associated protein
MLLIGLLCLGTTHVAQAEPRTDPWTDRWSVRGHVAAALLITYDQTHDALGYDGAGFLAGAGVNLDLISRLAAQWLVRGGSFLSEDKRDGGLVGSTLGLRLHGISGEVWPYLSFDVGFAATGKLWRPWIGGTFGIDWRVNDRFAVGPVVGVDDVIQWNGVGYTTDAAFMWFGINVAYNKAKRRPPKPAPAPPARVVVLHEREPPVTSMVELEHLIDRALPPGPRLELLAPVLFALDSDQLEPIGVAMLHEVSHTLHARPEILRLEVQGYADQRGNEAHNQDLSRRRAERVRNWLIEHGVAPERLSVASHGASSPVEAEASEGAYEQNRRVVFRVLELAEP